MDATTVFDDPCVFTRRTAFTLAIIPFASAYAVVLDDEQRDLDSFGDNVGRGDVNADMDAFGRASAWLEARGGGTINLRPGAIYSVGRQQLSGGKSDAYSWAPDPVLRCRGAERPVIINGNGAMLKAVSGLRYGTFDPQTGIKLATKSPYFGPYNHRAVPYEGMIELTGCTAGFTIRDLILDGTSSAAVLGGEFGDLGRQIPGSGLHLINNAGPVLIANVDSNNHCWDGMLFRHRTDNLGTTQAPVITIAHFRASGNGRQGMSLTGGHNVVMRNCEFRGSGTGTIASAPCSGLDIEAEGGQSVRNLRCTDCLFVANRGPGLLANGGDASQLAFIDCKFIGTNNYSAWPCHPAMSFAACLFVGPVIGVWGTKVAKDRVTFDGCRFTDDHSLSPTGTVYGSSGVGTPFLLDLGEGDVGARLANCYIIALHDARTVYAKGTSTHFIDCTLSEVTAKGSWPSGTFQGVNHIKSRGAHLDNVEVTANSLLYVNGIPYRPNG